MKQTNLIVIAKYYPPAFKGARAIQMERVVNALINFFEININVITIGSKNDIKYINKNLTIHAIKYQLDKNFIKKIIDKTIGDFEVLRNNYFVRSSFIIAKKLYIKNNNSILLTVSTPFDSHIAGKLLKIKHPEINWLAFLSDPWPLLFAPKPYKQFRLLSLYYKNLVSKSLNLCNGIIAPNNEILKIYETKLNIGINVKKFIVPHCGILNDLTTNNKSNGLIVHSGFFSKERVCKHFFIALNELYSQEPKFKGLVQIGKVCNKFKRFAKKYKCQNFITYIELTNEKDAQIIQSNYEIGLIIEAPMKKSVFTPSKLAEYPNINKKIIVISPKESPLQQIINGKDGFFVSDHNKEPIKQAFSKALANNESYIDSKTIKYFSPINVAKIYQKIFNTISVQQ